MALGGQGAPLPGFMRRYSGRRENRCAQHRRQRQPDGVPGDGDADAPVSITRPGQQPSRWWGRRASCSRWTPMALRGPRPVGARLLDALLADPILGNSSKAPGRGISRCPGVNTLTTAANARCRRAGHAAGAHGTEPSRRASASAGRTRRIFMRWRRRQPRPDGRAAANIARAWWAHRRARRGGGWVEASRSRGSRASAGRRCRGIPRSSLRGRGRRCSADCSAG